MNKKQVPVQELPSASYPRISLEDWRAVVKDGGVSVAVDHRHLDALIGSLMHLCDLVGGTQGEALKSEIKQRCRGWLDDQYFSAGYDKYGQKLN